MVTSNEIRSHFIDFYKKNGHTEVPSSSLVPNNDPTLLFTNAGMCPFKNVFTGVEERPYVRACSSQKCVRAGGKHNDLDNVGYTARHHTFFEMLGNFSFGDYFKEQAITFAWELLTQVFDIDAKRMLVTIYHDDDEAYALWKKVAGFSDDKIIRIATDDNFWRMADTGPCGPSSEIFFDHGDHIPGGPPGSPEEDGDRFVEIWNLVFMQFDQRSETELVSLPTPSIDTGSGMERLAAILQGKSDNYDTDIIRSLILASAEVSGVDPDGDFKFSHRVVADHLRSAAFLIADGVVPSNEGRGYVLRRIMRRAMRHAHMLRPDELHMYRLFPTLVQQMGDHFGELKTHQDNIVETLRIEETRFKRTLEKGIRLLEDEAEKLGEGEKLSGDVAFKLYDTYGFPFDLTQAAMLEKNMEVDVDKFETAMEKQRERARQSWVGSGDESSEAAWFPIREKIGATEFLGYTSNTAEAQVIGLFDKTAKQIEKAQAGEDIFIILNQTTFYAESGGQIGDTGIVYNDECTIEILDTRKKVDTLFVHVGKVTKGQISKGDVFITSIHENRRKAIRRSHTAAHLFHAAVRELLGSHVSQRGSLVAPDRFRFDVNFPTAINKESIQEIENAVNEKIRENIPVVTRSMSHDEAVKKGAMALFGEKYGEEVRVVSMADEETTYSIELCGGTHAERTGDIGLFKIVSEGAVAGNIRRIEALTGQAALEYLNDKDELLERVCCTLSSPHKDVESRLTRHLKELQDVIAENASLRRQLALSPGKIEGDDIKEIKNVRYICRLIENMDAKELRSLSDAFKSQLGSGIVVLVGVTDGKASLTVSLTEDVPEHFNAITLAKIGSLVLGGTGGGGRRTMAQAGGPSVEKANEALDAIESEIEKIA